MRHGYGRMLYYSNTHPLDSYIETYEGDWKGGKKWGKGRLVLFFLITMVIDFIGGKRWEKG